jgi:hypothetical protein
VEREGQDLALARHYQYDWRRLWTGGMCPIISCFSLHSFGKQLRTSNLELGLLLDATMRTSLAPVWCPYAICARGGRGAAG